MKRGLFLVLSLITLSFCTDQEEAPERSYPEVLTHSVIGITRDGAVFSGEIKHSGKVKIVEYGFVWGLFETLEVDNADKVVFNGSKSNGNFQAVVKSNLEEDKLYYVRAYARTSALIVYGPAVQFLSLGSKAPVISSFEPLTAKVLDTVNIKGAGFSYIKNSNEVKFGDVAALVANASDTMLRVIVPKELFLPKSRISVSVSGNVGIAPSDFELQGPTIKSVSQFTVKSCDTLTISGSNFTLNKLFLKVTLDGEECTIISNSEDIIKFSVPTFFPAQSTVKLKVISSNIESTYNTPLTYNKSQFLSIVPRTNTTFNDTVIVRGKNFPRCNTVKVKLKNTEVPIILLNDSLITFQIPESLTESLTTLSITFEGTPLAYSQPFTLSEPLIASVTPNTATFNDLVTITGKNFHPKIERNQAFLGGSNAVITSVTPTKIIASISLSAERNCSSCRNTYVQVNELTGTLANSFALRAPVLSSVNPSTIRNPGQVILNGNFFNPQADLNTVSIDNRLTILSATKTQIIANVDLNTVANGNPYISSTRVAQALVQAGGTFSAARNATFDYKGPWTQKADFPGTPRLYPVTFTADNKLFLCLGQSSTGQMMRDLWEYNPSTNSWAQRANFPGSGRTEANSFVLNNMVYVCFGKTETFAQLKDIWRYDPASDSWSRLNDFPGSERSNAEAFVINGEGFIAGGLGKTDVWKYNHTLDTWSQLQNAPVSITGQNNFVVGNNAYHIHLVSSFQFAIYEYNSSIDQWTFKITTSTNVSPLALSGGYIYDGVQKFIKYNAGTNSFTDLIMVAPKRNAGCGGEVQGKQYVFGGYRITQIVPFPQSQLLNDLWEFDVSRYPD